MEGQINKICSQCKIPKELNSDNFYKDNCCKDGFSTICKICRKIKAKTIDRTEYSKNFDSSNHGLNLAYIRKKYKINGRQFTIEDYNILLLEQENKCGCCKRSEPGGKGNKRFCVDHCHSTNEVRGLLCVACNRSIGGLGDSESAILNALNYISKFYKKKNFEI